MGIPVAKTKSGQSYKPPVASRSTGGNFTPIKPGKYLVEVVSAEEGHYKAGYKGVDGEYNYLKIRPIFKVHTPEKVVDLKFQDITIGTLDEDGALFRPDGDTEKSALFSGAQFFLSAIGFVNEVTDEEGNVLGEEVALDQYHTSLIGGQYFMGVVETKSYVSQGQPRQKNEIVNFFNLSDEQVAEFGLYRSDSGMVFRSEEQAALWLDLFENLPEDDGTDALDASDNLYDD